MGLSPTLGVEVTSVFFLSLFFFLYGGNKRILVTGNRQQHKSRMFYSEFLEEVRMLNKSKPDLENWIYLSSRQGLLLSPYYKVAMGGDNALQLHILEKEVKNIYSSVLRILKFFRTFSFWSIQKLSLGSHLFHFSKCKVMFTWAFMG